MPSLVQVTALALAIGGVGSWFAFRSGSVSAVAPDRGTPDIVAALRAQRWPEGLDLPAYYRDPELFFLKRHRKAQSALMTYWNALTRDQKLELLSDVRRLHTPFALPLLAEVAWFTLPTENDAHLASNLFAALGASSNEYVETAIYVAEFVAQTAGVAEVAEYAENCRAALVDRRQRLGR
jgi:hypothetical protein